MIGLKEIKNSFLHVLFPHVCCGCGTDNLPAESMLCMQCITALPETNFTIYPNNPVEKIFWGRLPLVTATAQYYFTKESLVQRLLHQLKYKGNRELGKQLGRLMGNDLLLTDRFSNIDALVPLPLFPAKEKRRGYNQATLLCEGISEIMKTPILNDVVVRVQHTESQTTRGRTERWENMSGKFKLTNPEIMKNKRILLVDDVVTTGATLEACGHELMQAPGTSLSIATLCFASS
jgi:ComF family protein